MKPYQRRYCNGCYKRNETRIINAKTEIKNDYSTIKIGEYIMHTHLGGQHLIPSQPVNFTEMILLSQLDSFDINATKPDTPARQWYYRDFFKNTPGLFLHSGYYPSHKDLLAAHMFRGEDVSKGTIMLIHGYRGSLIYSHFLFLTSTLIKKGYRVIGLDLIGHEFSGGYRGYVPNFSDYGDMVAHFIHYVGADNLGETVFMVGHSTGAVSIYDAMARYPEIASVIDKTVLLAPFYDLRNSRVYAFGAAFTNSIVNDQERLLQIYHIPSLWIEKQLDWTTKQAKKYQVITCDNMLLVFGGKDEIIKVEQSMDFFADKIPNANTVFFPKQNHVFENNKSEIISKKVLQWLLQTKKD